MAVRSQRIRSCADASCPRPWIEWGSFRVTPIGIKCAITRCTGPAASAEVRADATQERALERAHSFPFDLTALTPDGLVERHVLAITLDGELECVPVSKQRPVYYAHLAWIDPASGDADVLAFEDAGEHT